jgi:hypothetical protein
MAARRAVSICRWCLGITNSDLGGGSDLAILAERGGKEKGLELAIQVGLEVQKLVMRCP